MEEFEFLLKKLIVSGQGDFAWGITQWNSVGFDADGNSFNRPGRATVILQKVEETWLAVHTHFSLLPGTPYKTFGKK